MAHNWAHTQQENASEIWGIITQRSRRNMPTQEMGTLNRVGHETLQGLGTYGEVIDWTNKQASIGKFLEANPLTYNISKQLRESKIGDDILNFSYHDVRQGAVKWIGGKNQAAGVAANILLPDAVDFIGGVGYADNLVKAVNKYGPDLIGRLKNVPNAQAILKRGGQEANRLLDEAAQGLQTIVDPNAGRAFAMATSRGSSAASDVIDLGTDIHGRAITHSRKAYEKTLQKEVAKGNLPFGPFSKASKKQAAGMAEVYNFAPEIRKIQKAYPGDTNKIAKALTKDYHKGLKGTKYEYFTIDDIAKDKDGILSTLMKRSDDIDVSLADYRRMKRIGATSEALGTQFRKGADKFTLNPRVAGEKLLYDNSKLRKAISKTFNEIVGKEWHHIFGSKDAAQVMLARLAQDPYVAANLFEHLKRINLKTSGTPQNIALMLKKLHRKKGGLHPRLKHAGLEGLGAKASGIIGDYVEAISSAVLDDTTDITQIFEILSVYKHLDTDLRKIIKNTYDGTVISDLNPVMKFIEGA